jgi:uncharacterized protein (UPF0332 family)
MTLSSDEKQALALYRLEKARALLKDAETLLAASSAGSSTNRSYYALLTAARGLLALRGHDAETHEGVKVLLSRDFIKPGVLGREYAETFRVLQARRMDSDYGDYAEIQESEARDSLERARSFIAAIENVVNAMLGQV